ncbi:MAG: ABC transporter ATP-binding protein [Phocaeicola sp.]|nr:ABC transporter ATP-binding protein [Phocaeicola sp.]MDD7448884.1 ABC transporter ATP-binding protein [Prevotellaceae bacterium]MDY3913522.1 ABC transporter ATP-binding protein [Phocaeicola sp.]MDY5938279.1 ABC transporter ATP-binding protein [Phocaeicola sp.]
MNRKEFEIVNLSYRLSSKILLDNISFTVQENQKLAILGVNGSGKSLLFDGILGNIVCDFDKNSFIEKVHESGPYGILYDVFASFPLLTVREIVSLLSIIYNHKVDNALLEKFCLYELFDKQLKVLSKGENKKLGIYASLFFEPKVVFMDEPLDGLDPNSRHLFWDTISCMECTVIFTTHIWEEVTLHADAVMFIKDGKILNNPTPASELIGKYCPFEGKIVLSEIQALLLDSIPYWVHNKLNNEYIFYYTTDEEKRELLLKFNNNHISNLSILPITLRDVYNYITK